MYRIRSLFFAQKYERLFNAWSYGQDKTRQDNDSPHCHSCTKITKEGILQREFRIAIHTILKDLSHIIPGNNLVIGEVRRQTCGKCAKTLEGTLPQLQQKAQQLQNTITRYEGGQTRCVREKTKEVTRRNLALLLSAIARLEGFLQENQNTEKVSIPSDPPKDVKEPESFFTTETALELLKNQVSDLEDDEIESITQACNGNIETQNEAINILESLKAEYPHLSTACECLLGQINTQNNIPLLSREQLSIHDNPISQFLRDKRLFVDQLYIGTAVKLLISSLKNCKNNSDLASLFADQNVQSVILSLESNPENNFILEKYLASMFMKNQKSKGRGEYKNDFRVMTALGRIPFLKPKTPKVMKYIREYVDSGLRKLESVDYNADVDYNNPYWSLDDDIEDDPFLFKGFFANNSELIRQILLPAIKSFKEEKRYLPDILFQILKYGLTFKSQGKGSSERAIFNLIGNSMPLKVEDRWVWEK